MPGKKRKRGRKGGGKARRSRYVGVSWHKRGQKWWAQIQVRGVKQHLGLFHDEADGARAYDAAVAAQNLRYPRNFPGDTGAAHAVKKRDNISAIPDKGKSRFLGVSWNKRDKKWRVEISVKGKTEYIGLYDDETAAARAYDAYVIPNNIDKNLNFPDAPAAAGHRPTKQGGTSKYRGVSWNKNKNKWVAKIRVGGKRKSLGSFADEDDAGRAYDAAIRKYYPDEKPHKWKGYNFTAADGEEGSDDGDDTRSARGASSRGAAAVDASAEEEEEEEEEASAKKSRAKERKDRQAPRPPSATAPTAAHPKFPTANPTACAAAAR